MLVRITGTSVIEKGKTYKITPLVGLSVNRNAVVIRRKPIKAVTILS
jgi:hypothetical protein